MQILCAIAAVSFLALAWAAFAMMRHIRRDVSLASVPVLALKAARPAPVKAGPNRRKARASGERYDRTFSHADAGNLADPEPLRQPRAYN